MKKTVVGTIFKVTAIGVDVCVPMVVALNQFPLWVEQSAEATMSGICLVLIGLSIIPFLKQIREYFKSPSAWVVWGVILAILVLLRSIIDQILIVSFAGFIANIAGAFIYNIGKGFDKSKKKKENDE
jgi:hypothetical protein